MDQKLVLDLILYKYLGVVKTYLHIYHGFFCDLQHNATDLLTNNAELVFHSNLQ